MGAPAVTKLIIDPSEMGDYLSEVLGDAPWTHFEQFIIGIAVFGGIEFKMRIGLHMKRPTQAVMALGQFVKLRRANEYGRFKLKNLTPEAPDTCVYFHGWGQDMVPCWCPAPEVFEKLMGATKPEVPPGISRVMMDELILKPWLPRR